MLLSNIVVLICFVVITLSLIIFAFSSIIVASEIKKTGKHIIKLIEKLESDLLPLTYEIRMIIEDIRSVTKITRFQLEKIDSSINYATSNLVTMIDKVAKGMETLRRNFLLPFNYISAIMKGISRGLEYYFRKR